MFVNGARRPWPAEFKQIWDSNRGTLTVFLVDRSYPDCGDNLALDEALLNEADSASEPHELLRLWEAPSPMVVVGRSSRVAQEVNESYCRQAGIPVFRRESGGSAVVLGPACLNYSLILSYMLKPELRAIDVAHRFVLETVGGAIRPWVPGVELQGTSDLTVGGRKFSGNSLRCKRRALLYHGTLLCGFSTELIERCLLQPPRQPKYRSGRPHASFVVNLDVSADNLRQAMIAAWQATDRSAICPQVETARLSREKYNCRDWTYRL